MRCALERHRAEEAHVIPILIRSVDWRGTPISTLQMLPTEAKLVSLWSNRGEAFYDIARGIRDVVDLLLSRKTKEQHTEKRDIYLELTLREKEILHLVVKGLTSVQIARRLNVSRGTVNTHLRNIYRKLDVNSRSALVRFAIDHKLV